MEQTTLNLTAKGWIIVKLKEAGDSWLAIHELNIQGYSENALATRMSELAHDGLVVGRERQGKSFKEWHLTDETHKAATVVERHVSRPTVSGRLIGYEFGADRLHPGEVLLLIAVDKDKWTTAPARIEVRA